MKVSKILQFYKAYEVIDLLLFQNEVDHIQKHNNVKWIYISSSMIYLFDLAIHMANDCLVIDPLNRDHCSELLMTERNRSMLSIGTKTH